jgi:DNA-binding response OmpR family regulator
MLRRERSPRHDATLQSPSPPSAKAALLIGPSLATNQWVATVAKGSGYAVVAERRLSTLATYAPLEPDVVLVDAQADQCASMLATVAELGPNVRRRMLLVAWRPNWRAIKRALALGAADFVKMPCLSDELVVRMASVATRAGGGCMCDCLSQSVCAPVPWRAVRSGAGGADRPAGLARLTPREFELYRMLALREGEIVPRTELLAAAWGREGENRATSNVLDVYVRYLRLKLQEAKPEVRIETVRGTGYVLRRTAMTPLR